MASRSIARASPTPLSDRSSWWSRRAERPTTLTARFLKARPTSSCWISACPGTGWALPQAILRVRPNIKIVILTASDDEEDVTKALRMGAHGYILKDISGPDLVSAIEAIHRGDPYITPALASRLLMQKNRKSLSVQETRGSRPDDTRQADPGTPRQGTDQPGDCAQLRRERQDHQTLLDAGLPKDAGAQSRRGDDRGAKDAIGLDGQTPP